MKKTLFEEAKYLILNRLPKLKGEWFDGDELAYICITPLDLKNYLQDKVDSRKLINRWWDECYMLQEWFILTAESVDVLPNPLNADEFIRRALQETIELILLLTPFIRGIGKEDEPFELTDEIIELISQQVNKQTQFEWDAIYGLFCMDVK